MIKTGFALQLTKSCETSIDCLARELSLFDELSPEDLSIINQGRTHVHYKAGEQIFRVGTRPFGLLCLSSGKTKTSIKNIDGSELILSLKKPVEFLGFSDFILDRDYSVTVTALVDTDICVIMKKNFFRVAQYDHSVLNKINLSLVQEIDETRKRMIELNQRDVRHRLAIALMYVKEVYGSMLSDEDLGIDFTRADIAALSNLSIANVSRFLREFSREGIISFDKRKININQWKLQDHFGVGVYG